jgi:hypothetical protein
MVELRIFSFVRVVLWVLAALRDQRTTRGLAARFRVEPLQRSHSLLFGRNKGEILFILGSGLSINELTELHLATIARSASIGLNYWFLHPLVPTIYAFEGPARQYGEPTSQRREALVRLAGQAVSRFETASAPKLLHLRPSDGRVESLFPIPAKFLKRTILYGRANVVAKTERGLLSDLRNLIFLSRRGLLPASITPDNGASVVRLIFLGIAQGFRNIVLVGVDLDDRPHFYFSPKYSAHHDDLMAVNPPPSAGSSHETRTTAHRPFDTLTFLSSLASVMNRGERPSLWIGSASSQLAGPLPVFPWANSHRD